MISYNKLASGQVIRSNFNTDVSSATAFTMKLEPQNGEVIEKTPTLGTSDVVVGDETFLANQYCNHTTTASEFSTYTGKWRVNATATLASSVVASDYTEFRITE